MPDHIGRVLRRSLADMGLGPTSDLGRLLDGWEALVGARIAAQASPLAVKETRKGKELVIAVPDAVWRQELSLMQGELLARVNSMLPDGQIGQLRLVGTQPAALEESPFRERPRKLRRPAGGLAASPTASPTAAESTPDTLSPRLRSAFERLSRARAARLGRDGE